MRQLVDVISRRKSEEQRTQMLLTEWQTRLLCQFIGATVGVHLERGAPNPLVEQANEISIFPRSLETDPDDPRGEVTGYMTPDGSWERVQGKSAPPLTTLAAAVEAAGDTGEIEGVALGSESTPDELAIGSAARPGSYEAFMGLFGPNGKAMPANTAPQPT